MSLSLGIDIGGTFTDTVVMDEAGRISTYKSPSTPDAPLEALLANLTENGRERGLSLEGMDKVLAVQHLSVLDLLDPTEVNKRASILPPSGDEFENVLLTDGTVAATQSLITSMNVKEILKFKIYPHKVKDIIED